MIGLEITVMLGVAVFAGAVFAPRLRVPAPLLLLVVGSLLGSFPSYATSSCHLRRCCFFFFFFFFP